MCPPIGLLELACHRSLIRDPRANSALIASRPLLSTLIFQIPQLDLGFAQVQHIEQWTTWHRQRVQAKIKIDRGHFKGEKCSPHSQ